MRTLVDDYVKYKALLRVLKEKSIEFKKQISQRIDSAKIKLVRKMDNPGQSKYTLINLISFVLEESK